MNSILHDRSWLLFAAIFAISGLSEVFSTESPRPPNFILIVADDLGYGELGCYGGTEIPTPHLDRLAANGIRFTDGYVTAPFCAASRAALLTGRYQTSFGFEFNPIGAKNAIPGIGLPVDQLTLADRLRNVGYVTSLVGKWHLGGTPEFHPQRCGFDEFFGFLHEGHYYVPPPWTNVTTWLRRAKLPDGRVGRWTSPDGRTVWSTHLSNNEPDYDADNPIIRNSQPIDEQANLTDAFTREACGFIDRHRSQPFFLTLSFNAVHSPMQGADAYLKRFTHIDDIHRRIFAALLSHLDNSVGRVMDQIRASGIEENTLIVFISDNGGPTKELTSSNAPLRGGKGSLWEGGVRVPFIISGKGIKSPGSTSTNPVSTLDLVPTMLDATGRVAGLPNNLDGQSLWPELQSQKPSETVRTSALYWRVGRKQAIRKDNWKLIREEGTWQLFDLDNDIGETIDLAAREPQRTQELSRMWEQWNSQQIEPLWK